MSFRLAPAVALLLTAIPAAAADFTINVPVTLENMPAARRILVVCTVYDNDRSGGDTRSVVGSGSSPWFDVTGGRHSATIRVEFNAEVSRGPSAARSYSCNLQVQGVRADGRPFDSGYTALAGSWREITGQTLSVTPEGTVVRGAIPR